jgi:hypothetical protein
MRIVTMLALFAFVAMHAMTESVTIAQAQATAPYTMIAAR